MEFQSQLQAIEHAETEGYEAGRTLAIEHYDSLTQAGIGDGDYQISTEQLVAKLNRYINSWSKPSDSPFSDEAATVLGIPDEHRKAWMSAYEQATNKGAIECAREQLAEIAE